MRAFKYHLCSAGVSKGVTLCGLEPWPGIQEDFQSVHLSVWMGAPGPRGLALPQHSMVLTFKKSFPAKNGQLKVVGFPRPVSKSKLTGIFGESRELFHLLGKGCQCILPLLGKLRIV